jgi:hypothetical protein
MQADVPVQQGLLLPNPLVAPRAHVRMLRGRTLDKVVESQNRRLLAVATPNSLDREAVSSADNMLDKLSLAFFAASDEPLCRAFESALTSARQPQRTQVRATAYDGGLVAAALHGERLAISASGAGIAIVQQGDRIYSIPEQVSDRESMRYADAGPMGDKTTENRIYETRLEPGDVVALLSGGDFDPGRNTDSQRLTKERVAGLAGEQGAWVWIEIEPPPAGRGDRLLRLRSAPQEATPKIWTTSVQPAAPLWDRASAKGTGLFAKAPALDTLRKYDGGTRDSFGLVARSRMPRGHPPLLALALAVLLLAGAVAAAAFAFQQRSPGSVSETAVTLQTQALGAALDGGNNDQIAALLPEAERILATASDSEAANHDLPILERQVQEANDRLAGIERISGMQLVGDLPMSIAAGQPGLAITREKLVLLSGKAYEIDPTSLKIMPMPYDSDSAFDPEASLLSVPTSTGAILSTDGTWLEEIDSNGQSSFIGSVTLPPGFNAETVRATGFQQKLYLLDSESGELYVADGQSAELWRWLAESDAPLPGGAIDVEINGSIHVLYADGQVLSLNSGSLTNSVALDNGTDDYVALESAFGTNSGQLYVAGVRDGESVLTIVDLSSGSTRDLNLPPFDDSNESGASLVAESFAHMDDFVVREDKIFWIGDGALWSADLPH